MPDLSFRIVHHGSADYLETVALRDDVLRRPLGLVFTPEQLGAEAADIHLAAYLDDALVACLILVPLANGEIKMRQVAVRHDLQSKGIGRSLVEESERIARERGFQHMILNARQTAVPFYERLGYTTIGPEFLEVTIPHRRMERSLSVDRPA